MSATSKRKGLTPKQARFVAEYAKDLNATAAAKRAGYSAKTAGSQAHDLLKKPEIAAAVADREAKHAEKVGLTQDEILLELRRIGHADVGEAFHRDGSLKALHDMPEDVRRAISSIETVEYFEGQGEDRDQVGVIRKVKFWDKPRGLELSGKHLGMFADRVQHDIGPTLEDLLNKAAGK